jgi:hypothetical protein
MNDTLDEHILNKEKRGVGIFSKVSFGFALFMVFKMIHSIILTPSVIGANEDLSVTDEGSNFHYLTFLVIAGGVCALLSILKKEENNLIKWFGAIINVLWFILMIIGIILTL